MDYFRNIVVVAALAGGIAGLGMTIAQQLSTVPLILKAEVYEEQSAAPVARAWRCRRAGRSARAWRWRLGAGRRLRAHGLLGPRQYRHRHRLRAAARRRERVVRRHQGLAPGCVLGAGRFCRLHARARAWPSARAPGHAGGRAWRAPALVGRRPRFARRRRLASWSISDRSSRSLRRSRCWSRRI